MEAASFLDEEMVCRAAPAPAEGLQVVSGDTDQDTVNPDWPGVRIRSETGLQVQSEACETQTATCSVTWTAKVRAGIGETATPEGKARAARRARQGKALPVHAWLPDSNPRTYEKEGEN